MITSIFLFETNILISTITRSVSHSIVKILSLQIEKYNAREACLWVSHGFQTSHLLYFGPNWLKSVAVLITLKNFFFKSFYSFMKLIWFFLVFIFFNNMPVCDDLLIRNVIFQFWWKNSSVTKRQRMLSVFRLKSYSVRGNYHYQYGKHLWTRLIFSQKMV